ncbi:MAG TPA: hypothetical protein VGA73_13180, partial [Candidatus Binatia bacterium]
LVQGEDGFLLVLLEDDATVRDARGALIALSDLPLGSAVEYEARYWEGQAFATSLRMSAARLVIGAR